ncbi:hypothetical protein P8935_21430 [Telmatobacter sp. DSM 110680]|uniref:Uncharacterized protein n=1 Tax=Telmatobacter sp. DSM 110680 TaxID=3036704 RepID=A0AAU7DK30_9BACT
MNASQATKYGPSVVAETLRSLSDHAKVCHEKIDLLEAGQGLNRGEVLFEVGRLLDACQNLRDAILSEDSAASWSTRTELGALVNRLDDAAAKRRIYLDLAGVLAAGTISHRRERTRLERMALRDKAVAELMEVSEQSAPPELPGPDAKNWLEWACSLEDETHEPELRKLKDGFPRLDDFVRQLEIDWWHDGPSRESTEKRSTSKTAPATRNGSNGTRLAGDGNGNGSLKQFAVGEKIAVEESPLFIAEKVDPLPVLESPAIQEKAEVTQVVHEAPAETGVLTLAAVDESPFAEEDAVELSTDALSPTRKGKISFFPWEQVEQFMRRIESGKVERKDARTIRALLAVSHWLEPKDQNPMTHAKCGIRALTEYPPTTEPVYVAPGDVMQFITQEDGLPLLTGGADLLRWGLLQPSERNFQGVASVRRFTVEHLRAWFSDLFRIALSDKQIEDIFNLTSGIPYLVGELHKLIVPQPDEPPTWLGLARWMEIKAQFEKQLPQYAHELKKGIPAVRLTDREISLLNMVVIASGDSTAETIVANLSDNWEKYQHPEYRALSSRDEVSVAVLLELGLLPRRNVMGGAPSKALLPVKQDDAIRKIAELL